MSIELLKPSDFANEFPCMSITADAHLESIAQRIMELLARTGDEWRKLTWYEYRLVYSNDSRSDFQLVCYYCTSAENAMSFSRYWYDAGAYAYSYLRLAMEG